MKTILIIAALAGLRLTAMAEQPKTTIASAKAYQTVFEVTSNDPGRWLGALRNVQNVRKSLGVETKILVVAHGGGLGMLLAKSEAANAELKSALERLHQDGVTFAACENTMKRDHVEKKDLSDSATTVDSGVAEVIRKQADGYAYINIGS